MMQFLSTSIIGHVVAESYANKRSAHGRRQVVATL
jgi:hypothetical protein